MNRLVSMILGLLLVMATLSSCKKCGHCEYDNGTREDSYCNNGDNYNPNIYNSYKANCEYRTNSHWVED